MKKALMLAALAAFAAGATGCSVTKVNYEKDDTGKVSYRLYRNDHWLKTSGTGIKGGMTKDGKFEFAAEGLEKSPSEEFNRVMATYTSAVVQLMQIAAAAYNPSASTAAAGKEATTVNVQVPSTDAAQTSASTGSASDPHAADCPDGICEAK